MNVPKKAVTQKAKRRAPATTLEAREKQLVSLAVDLAERQLSDGTATSQVITHYLKLGSTRDKLEQEIMIEQKKLLVAKTEAMASSQRVEALYKDALNAMRNYSGQEEIDYDDE